MARAETLRTSLDVLVYVGMSMYLISRAVQKFTWLQKDELGTIYKMASPGFITYPSITLCPMPTVEAIRASHTLNESWAVPEPSLDVLTGVAENYYVNDRYFFEKLSRKFSTHL